MAEEKKPTPAISVLIESFGGRERFMQAIDKRYDDFAAAWNQDVERIGRVLRAHLAVEHFVTTYLTARHPGLGPLDRARLSYAQKVDLLNPEDSIIKTILPGLRLLGQIRNRVAHRLRVELTVDDEKAFLNIELFRAMRDRMKEEAPQGYVGPTADTCLAVLEEFAKFAAGLLHAGADPDRDLWSKAMKSVAEDLKGQNGA